MSHSEIWDDSALIDSWNDALKEYKQYHSLAARGEKLSDIVKNSTDQSNGLAGATDYEDVGVHEEQADVVHTRTNLPGETVDIGSPAPIGNTRVEKMNPVITDQATNLTTSQAPELPQHLIGNVHDEGLKNLLMAWYYAGYYTGLQEGKQQGTAGKVDQMA